MNRPRRASIVVPCYNEQAFIEGVVRGVLGPGRSSQIVEMLVVDGDSKDGTVEVLSALEREFQDLHVLSNPVHEIPRSMNMGILAARGDVIIRMDAHSRYPPNYVDMLLDRLSVSPGAGNVGGGLETLPANESLEARVVAKVGSSPFGVGSALFRVGHLKITDSDTVPFGCIPREVFDQVGLYDEQLVRNEDDELNARIRAAGFRVVLDPSIRIGYFSRPTIGKLTRMFFQYGRFKPLVALKARRLTSVRQLAPPALVLSLALLAAGAIFFPVAVWALLALLGAYGAFLIAGASHALRGERLGLGGFLLSCVCLTAVHLSYGLGYVQGAVEFVVLRRHRHERLHAALTR